MSGTLGCFDVGHPSGLPPPPEFPSSSLQSERHYFLNYSHWGEVAVQRSNPSPSPKTPSRWRRWFLIKKAWRIRHRLLFRVNLNVGSTPPEQSTESIFPRQRLHLLEDFNQLSDKKGPLTFLYFCSHRHIGPDRYLLNWFCVQREMRHCMSLCLVAS